MKAYPPVSRSLLALVAGMMLTILSGQSRADGQLGSLTCNRIEGTGLNLLLYSSAEVRCTFEGSAGAEQWYIGSTGIALGVDLKWNKEETIYFGVLSSTVEFVPEGDFLSGKYGGAKADAALGIGVGAAVLLGGSNDTIAMQPAVESSTGIGVAAGLSYLNLEPDPLNKARMVTPHGTILAQAMYAGYFNHAFNYYRRPVYEASDYFSEKAIVASSGLPPAPDETTKWQLPEAQQSVADAARERLLAALKNSGGAHVDAAMAQVRFDCWLYALGHEEESDNVATCRDSFNARLEKVKMAVAEKRAEKSLMQPTWHMVLFATDSAKLDKHAGLVVDDVLMTLGKLDNARVHVMGNADRVGPKAYNLTLSEKRAKSVSSALVAAGVPNTWVTSEIFGEHNPISISHNPHDALNRRVDITVEPMEVKPEAIKEEASKKTKE